MKQLVLGTALALTMILASCAETEPYEGPQRFLTIGTGGVAGVYYPAGGAICRFVNKRRKEHGIRCGVESTSGSVYNLRAIRGGELEMGVAQSDWQYHAYNGTSKFKGQGPNKELRAVFSLYPEPFTVVARVDSDIKDFTDLRGKRVNIGNPGSGQRTTMNVVMRAFGWSKGDFSLASELKWSEQAQALCDNKVDAIIYTVGHPSGSIYEVTKSCEAVFVAVTDTAIDKLVANNAFYRKAVIPGRMYRSNPDDINSFGVGVTVVTSTDTPPDVIYWVVKSIFEDLSSFRRLHPAFAKLKKKEMVRDSLSAPLHEGALRYYREAGLL